MDLKEQMAAPIRGVVFDMDGLIFDSERVVQRSWELTGNELGIEHLGEHIYNTIGFNRNRRMQYFHENVKADFPDELFAERSRIHFRSIIEKEGLKKKPGVMELLKYLKSKGYKVAVATSTSRESAVPLLQENGIYGYLDGIVCGDMVRAAKPNPEIYLRACEQIQVRPQEALALEDAPAGIRSATSAGMRAIVIPDLVQPDDEICRLAWYRFDSLLEVLDLLGRKDNL